MYKVLGFIAVMSLILIDTVIIGYVTKVYFIESETIIAGCIAFVGAIIGGYITLQGVNKTLKHNSEQKKLETLPKKINNAWKLMRIMVFTDVIGNLDLTDIKRREKIDDFYNETELSASELAADTTSEIYNLVNRYYTLISDYYSYEMKGKLDLWYEETRKFNDELSRKIQQLENEYENLERNYN